MKSPSSKLSFNYDAFISCSHKNKDVVDKLIARLRADGFQLWIDEDQIGGGNPLRQVIIDGIAQSKHVIVCLSQSYIDSKWATFESAINQTLDIDSRNRRLIPVRVAAGEIPLEYRHLYCPDLTNMGTWEQQYQKAIKSIGKSVGTSALIANGFADRQWGTSNSPGKLDRKLGVFLCHASQDKPVVRELYQKLATESWIDPWFDEEKLYPGQDWHWEIEKAVRNADAVVVCLSNHSVNKEGYIQRELRFVLNIADEKPEGSIFVIPLRLNDCMVPPRLRILQYVDYYPRERKDCAYRRLIEALIIRQNSIQ